MGHFQLLQLTCYVTGIRWVEIRDFAKRLTAQRQPLQQRIIQPSMAIVQNLRILTKSDLGLILVRWQFLRYIWSLLRYRVIRSEQA